MGDTLVPEEWTAYFGVQPTDSGIKGAYRKTTRTGQDLYRRSGLWLLESNIVSDDLEPHLLNLIEALQLPRPDMSEILRSKNVRSDFFCFWMNETGDRVPVISDATKAILNECGIVLEIDEYQ